MIKIGTLEIPDQAGFDVRIDISDIGPKSVLRTKNGRGIDTSRWSKAGISISASGWIPDGLHSIDKKQVVDIHTIDFKATLDVSNIISIPGVFRTDNYAPQGLAFVNGDMVSTPISLSGSVATLTIVSGATLYQVNYCPIITSIITSIDRQFDENNSVWSWSLEAEEQ